MFRRMCEFVRVHFDDLIDRYHQEGRGSLNDFPARAVERYLKPGGSARKISVAGGSGAHRDHPDRLADLDTNR